MPLAALATSLTLLALALPFLFAFTQPPINNFWPLLASWTCAVILVLLAMARASRRAAAGQSASGDAPWQVVSAGHLMAGLVLASLIAAVIGLVQYFFGDPGIPGFQPSVLGEAVGNLRQRNQQATLLSMGAWAVLWFLLRRARPLSRPTLQWTLAAFALALLAVASAATASRTGALQWLCLVGMLVLWGGRERRAVLVLGLCTVALYGLAAWGLPQILLHWRGVATDGLFERFVTAEQVCGSRRVLWANILHLIGQKPWLGWGWGELDYAHYVTLFPGERFCVLLDNAHNLPLHLAVELGVPVALVLCLGMAAWVWHHTPWRETVAARQLAWGVLVMVGVHSLLEFPLWYGPFQLVTVLAVLLLCRSPVPRWAAREGARLGVVAVMAAMLMLGAYAAWDFYRVGMLYRPLEDRPPAWRTDTVRKVGDTPFFTDQVDFALLTTLKLTPDNAAQAFAVANKLLHYSPEPRVIEQLIESAVMLGLDDEAAFHLRRYRAAFPADYARWREKNSQPASRPEP